MYLKWETSLEKLKILNYEQSFCNSKRLPFNRIHFILPAKNLSAQFDDFIDICQWLFSEITKKNDFFRRDQYDDPNTVCNKLLLALRQLDFRPSFPSQKLKTPNGESVLLVLEFLIDKALETNSFKFNAPVYLDKAKYGRSSYIIFSVLLIFSSILMSTLSV